LSFSLVVIFILMGIILTSIDGGSPRLLLKTFPISPQVFVPLAHDNVEPIPQAPDFVLFLL